MTKKITPDPPHICKDSETLDVPLYKAESVAVSLDTLAFTLSKSVTSEGSGKHSLLSIPGGINVQDALSYVSKLLETAELNGDEIGLHTNPVERTLFWSMLHSIEVSRAVVDALLERACSPQ